MSTGSSPVTLPAARAAIAAGSIPLAATAAPDPQPERPSASRAMTFMNASVASSRARVPADEAIAVSTAPAVQIPNASSDRSAHVSNATRSAAPASAGSSAAVAASKPSASPAGSGAGGAGDRADAGGAAAGLGRGEAGVLAAPAGRRGGRPRAGVGARGDVAQALLGQVVRVGGAGVALVDPQDRHGRVVDLGRLRRLRAGEARDERALAHDGRLRVAGAVRQRALGDVESAHATPTC